MRSAHTPHELAKAPSSQTITSKNTSINSSKLPKGISFLLSEYEISAKRVLDYGCGKFSNTQASIEAAEAKYIPYDPYNLLFEVNLSSIDEITTNGVDFIVCSNVLNVIREDSALDETISRLKQLVLDNPNCTLIVTIYDGNRTGIGAKTRNDQYQRNEKLNDYIDRFTRESDINAKTKKGCLIISNLSA